MAWSLERLACALLRLVSMAASLPQGLGAVRAVDGLHDRRVGLVARAPFFRARIVGLGLVGQGRAGGNGGRCGRRSAGGAEEVAATHRRLVLFGHLRSSVMREESTRMHIEFDLTLSRHASMAKASASMSKKHRPRAATAL